jgi:hypothetical protein
MLFLKAMMIKKGTLPGLHRWLEVSTTGQVGEPWVGSVEPFPFLCHALMADVQSADGSGGDVLGAVRAIELGQETYIEADGNAWIAFITPHEVWFEGLYDQGSGGAVSFRQYKLAVETWIQFLSDPERKPIVVPFPEDVLDPATLPPRPPRNEE